MREIRSWVVIACTLAACKGQSASTATEGSDETIELAKMEGEIPLVLGDCAPAGTPFVSGPEPQSFRLEDLASPATKLYATMASGGDVVATIGRGLGATPTSTPYIPGAASALSELRILLVDCFRMQGRHDAAAVFDLAPGAIRAHGIAHPLFTKCVGEIASQVKVKSPMRCAATFGSATADSLPAVDIAQDTVRFLGKRVTDIRKAGEEHVKATLATKDPLTLHGPIAVRPLPGTPMKTVIETALALIAAGEDPVLAAQRDGTWQLVRNYPLPMLPVPLGTGGSWTSDRARREPSDSAGPTLSVLVDTNDVWIAMSRESAGKRVPFAKLKEELAARKASPEFIDRDDIEIAGADEVPYSRVVEAIDIANGAGFRGWSLTSASGLSVPPR